MSHAKKGTNIWSSLKRGKFLGSWENKDGGKILLDVPNWQIQFILIFIIVTFKLLQFFIHKISFPWTHSFHMWRLLLTHDGKVSPFVLQRESNTPSLLCYYVTDINIQQWHSHSFKLNTKILELNGEVQWFIWYYVWESPVYRLA